MPPRVPHRTANNTDNNNKHDNRDRETMTPPTVANALLRLPPLPPPLSCHRCYSDSSHASKSTSRPL